MMPLGGVAASGWLLMYVSGDAVRLTLGFVVAGSLLYVAARRGPASPLVRLRRAGRESPPA